MKKIHQIWIGPNPIDPLCETYSKKLKDTHPDWKYTLWTEENIPADILKMARGISDKIIEQADVIRMCILFAQGGTYLDLDMDCMVNLNNLYNSLQDDRLMCTKHIFGKYDISFIMTKMAGHPLLFEYIKAVTPSNLTTFEKTGMYLWSAIIDASDDYAIGIDVSTRSKFIVHRSTKNSFIVNLKNKKE